MSKVQEASIILKMGFALSKCPHLLHKMGFVDSLTHTTVHSLGRQHLTEQHFQSCFTHSLKIPSDTPVVQFLRNIDILRMVTELLMVKNSKIPSTPLVHYALRVSKQLTKQTTQENVQKCQEFSHFRRKNLQ